MYVYTYIHNIYIYNIYIYISYNIKGCDSDPHTHIHTNVVTTKGTPGANRHRSHVHVPSLAVGVMPRIPVIPVIFHKGHAINVAIIFCS